jgi:hypothetical protein
LIATCPTCRAEAKFSYESYTLEAYGPFKDAQNMTPIDYRAWVERVRAFSEGLRGLPGKINVTVQIEPTISEEALEDVSKKWISGLPEALHRLWREGSSAINCRYVWTPSEAELSRLHEVFDSNDYIYGGARFEPATSIFPGNSGAEPDDDCMSETVGKQGLDLWCRCAVFLHVGNGDCLGLDPGTHPDDPAVVYLLHDGEESGQISPSFTDFLAAWEELSYIGPEFWLLDYWLDWDHGVIDVTKHKARELRELLSPRSESPKV